ncbi:MAG: M3 family metallopeptidase, partial [bacterium]
ELYSKLFISSSSEWKSLYNELISNIKVEFENEIISISKLRNFYNHFDRNLRQKAYNKELQIFKEYEYIFSRILNSVKWDSIVISQKRKFNSLLDKSLFENDIDKEILDIVLNTTFENLSTVRKYFYKKASLMNLDKLEWFDISAPIYEDKSVIFDFEKAKNFILDNFARFSNEMYELALKAFEEGWIDAEPRLGKTDGGFCIYIFSNQSRILVNYDNSIKSLLTLAHELGHAYHNYVMSENTPIYRYSPLILAETASILAETITRKNALKNLTDTKTKTIILDGYLYTISVVTVDIISRFLFEDKVIKIREQRILTPSELCNIMIDSQKEVYFDSINSYHPYMWANKPHYYISNYYNYPYLVGLLVGLSLFNLYESNKISAKDYREILKNSGKDKPERILKNFGLNIRSKNFWQEAFDLIAKDIEEFDKLPPVR